MIHNELNSTIPIQLPKLFSPTGNRCQNRRNRDEKERDKEAERKRKEQKEKRNVNWRTSDCVNQLKWHVNWRAHQLKIDEDAEIHQQEQQMQKKLQE